MPEPMTRRFTCDWLFNILVVLCDGKVVCGCADPNGERPLGNLNDTSILDIWNSNKVHQIRQDLNNGGSSFCKPCGLKRFLEPDESIPQASVHQETLPRIFFEPTILCNLSCHESVCSKDSKIMQTRSRKYFPLDEFKDLMDQIGSDLIRLDFFNYGESFVHPDAIHMIEYFKEKFPSVYLYISTNGLLLDQQKIQRIVKAGVEEITFSVDGADQETYARYRCGGDFAKILESMRECVRQRDEAGTTLPIINWRCILFKWNDSRKHMNQIRRLAEKIGVDRLIWEITDHPESARSSKYQIGTKEWQKIYYEIWDTSQLTNAIKSKRYQAKLKVAGPETIGSSQSFRVKIKNTGGAVWLHQTPTGRRTVRLGIQLYDADRHLLNQDFAREFLPGPVRGGESVTVDITLPAFPAPGENWLKFDMVSEGIDWFESTGSRVVWKKIRVT